MIVAVNFEGIWELLAIGVGVVLLALAAVVSVHTDQNFEEPTADTRRGFEVNLKAAPFKDE
jgi:hypothetical protein